MLSLSLSPLKPSPISCHFYAKPYQFGPLSLILIPYLHSHSSLPYCHSTFKSNRSSIHFCDVGWQGSTLVLQASRNLSPNFMTHRLPKSERQAWLCLYPTMMLVLQASLIICVFNSLKGKFNGAKLDSSSRIRWLMSTEAILYSPMLEPVPLGVGIR